MYFQPKIITISEKKLVGKKVIMSRINDRTFELWHSFMPNRKLITNNLNNNLVSLSVYFDSSQIANPNMNFEKWSAVEVSDFNAVPDVFETFTLKSGLYAMFDYKGLHSDPNIFIYIFTNWLPNSDYFLDERPHFEILGEKYRNNDPNSEEEIYIPIKPKM